MGLLDDLNAANKTSNQCKICLVLSECDQEERKALEAALSDTYMAHTTVAAIITKNKLQVSETSVRRHRANHSKGNI